MVRGELAITEEKEPDRDWKEYHEYLFQRGEILLAVKSLQGWQEGTPGDETREERATIPLPSQLDLVLGDIASGLRSTLSPTGRAD